MSANRLSANRLSANRLSANRLSANRLSANRLALDPVSSADLIETDDGREVLTYIVSCAVPAGTTLVGTDSHGTSYEFFGEIGLAPRWLDHPLNKTGRGWISACLFSRVNAHAVAVPVSLRGPSSALVTTPDEVANWTLQEGAFYGDFFRPITEPINWIACRGTDSAQAHLAQRDCTLADPTNPGKTMCGFTDAGDCFANFPNPMRACRKFSTNGYYLDCADHQMFQNRHNHDDDDRDDGDDGENDDDQGDGGHEGDGEGGHDDHDHSSFFRQVITTFVHS